MSGFRNADLAPLKKRNHGLSTRMPTCDGRKRGLNLNRMINVADGWLHRPPVNQAEEIENSISFLKATGSEVPERQHSIQAVFAYSWQDMLNFRCMQVGMSAMASGLQGNVGLS